MTLSRFMRDRDGVVHELFPYGQVRAIGWSWPTGHVDARMRLADPAPDATAPTCLVCIRAWEKLPEHMREQAFAIAQRIVR